MSTTASLENYIEGPRWLLHEGMVAKAVIQANAVIGELAQEQKQVIDPITLVYEKRATTWTRATIFFRLLGPDFVLEAFRAEIERSVAARNMGL